MIFFSELQIPPMFKLTSLKHGDKTCYGPTIFAAYATTCQIKKRKRLHYEMKDFVTSQTRVRKPVQSTIGLEATDGDWAMFIDTWTYNKEMHELTDPAVI